MATAVDPAAQKRLSYVDAADAAALDLSRNFDAAGLSALREIVISYPDTGDAGAGEVAASLFMQLERLIADERVDREALDIRLRAWRLLLVTTPNPGATAVLM